MLLNLNADDLNPVTYTCEYLEYISLPVKESTVIKPTFQRRFSTLGKREIPYPHWASVTDYARNPLLIEDPCSTVVVDDDVLV